jgi:hypothetical protein
VAGSKNAVADFLSHLYVVPNATKKSDFGHQSAQHITPLFAPLSVISKEDIMEKFFDNVVTPCSMPDLCHLNVNNSLYKNLGPFNPTFTCLEETPPKPTAKKVRRKRGYFRVPSKIVTKTSYKRKFLFGTTKRLEIKRHHRSIGK